MTEQYDSAGEMASVSSLGPARATKAPEVEIPSQVTISFHEARAIIGVSRNTLYRLLHAKKIPGVRKLGGTWRFHRATLLRWLACE
jgi:excisionase family DNA binding protein